MIRHPVFYEDEWRARFSTDEIASITYFELNHSPINILATNDFRAQIRDQDEFGPKIPVDIFTFGRGEGNDRMGTKVGGLPYRRKDTPWPVDESGEPYAFLAQFCFSDSKDLVGELPGDVLLVFLRTSKSEWEGETRSFLTPSALWEKWEKGLIFEWQNEGLKNLIEKKDLTLGPLNLQMPTCYGVRYRTTDYVDPIAAATSYLSRESRCVPDTFPTTYGRFVWHMMKIGGTPVLLGEVTPPCPGRFIAGFGGVVLTPLTAYPWINQSEPLSLERAAAEENMLLLGDPGYLNIYLEHDGKLDFQFYYKS